MNLTLFLKKVDSLSASMEKEALAEFVHETARILPEKERDAFLHRMQKLSSGRPAEAAAPERADKLRYQQLKERLEAIESWEVSLAGQLNEEYDDWYDNVSDEFRFSDPEGIGQSIEDAVSFVQECVERGWFQEGYETANLLIGLKIRVGGEYEDYSDEPFSLDDLEYYHLITLDYPALVTDSLYLTYCVKAPEERPEALYDMLQQSRAGDVSLEDVMQRGEELPELQNFLPAWIAFLGDKKTKIAQNLLEEALSLVGDTDTLLANARRCVKAHPGLYEKYLLDMRESLSADELLRIGAEALEGIDKKYVVRSRIALQMADIRLKEAGVVDEETERLWLEAFRSDTRPVHFLRLLLECRDYDVWKEEISRINDEMLRYGNEPTYGGSLSRELKENVPGRDGSLLIAFLNGGQDYVLHTAMNVKKPLGWSGTFMKPGLAALLLLLMNMERLPESGKPMLSRIFSCSGLSAEEYGEGLHRPALDAQELLWKGFCAARQRARLSQSEAEGYLKQAKTLIKKRTKAIMENNRRNYYQECAEYISALGEALESMGDTGAKQRLFLEYRQAYPRRSAFRQELRTCGMKD